MRFELNSRRISSTVYGGKIAEKIAFVENKIRSCSVQLNEPGSSLQTAAPKKITASFVFPCLNIIINSRGLKC